MAAPSLRKRFFIPSNLWRTPAAQLATSTAARVALDRLRVKELGDLDGISFEELRRYLRGRSDWLSIGCELEGAVDYLRRRLGRQPALQTQGPPLLSTGGGSDAVAPRAHIGKEDGSAPNTHEDEGIFIPVSERGRPISEFPVSVRLGHLFEFAGTRVIGDLHSRTYVELAKYRNTGRKTLAELRELVRQIQLTTSSEITPHLAAPVNPHLFAVAPTAHEVNVAELPVSVRLKNVLEACGVKNLGALDHRDERELLAVQNCGRKTIRELRELVRRASEDEFLAGDTGEIADCLREIARAIDVGLSHTAARNRTILVQRLSGNAGDLRTLEDVGAEFKMTRERVRQIVKKTVAEMRQAGGPRLARALEGVARECEQRVSPLTPELFGRWSGEGAPTREHAPEFYLRILDTMAPAIPAWPPGSTSEGANDPAIEGINESVEYLLRLSGENPSLKEALGRLQKRPGFRKVNVGAFLTALRRARHVIVDFVEPERPKLRLRRLRIADFARSILAESSEPLPPEEIVERARVKFGTEAIIVTGRSAANSLTPEQGFYLLGPRALGNRSHFHAPESRWRKIRDAFEKLLHIENRPVSTIEAIDTVRIEVPAGVNSYELAQILREDERFADLGRHLFGLAEWGIQEREHVKDLLPRVFVEAGHALTVAQLLERLTRLRSVSPTGVSSIVRHHPEIRAFGFGYFGLKNWNDKETEVILRDRNAIHSAVRQSKWAISFAQLCDLFDILPGTARAELLWRTCAGSGKLRRSPDKCSPDTVLLHKAVSLELAVAAIMRELARPAPAYELQWEVAAKFGAIFAHIQLPAIESRLAASPRFLRNAAGEFLLDIDFEMEDFDAEALRAATIRTLAQSRDIADCDELIERLELDGFELEEMSPEMLASILRGSQGLQEVGSRRFRAVT